MSTRSSVESVLSRVISLSPGPGSSRGTTSATPHRASACISSTRKPTIRLPYSPGRGFRVVAPPAAQPGTWAVVAGVDGLEKNVFWKRVDDGSRPGYAEIVDFGEKVFGAGDVVTFLPESIHSVTNDTAAVTVSLHVYGKHVNYTARSQFDPETRVAKEFKVVQTG